ncbi:polysaccharide deacetylase [SAR202 cluster bacterium AC-409-J13_OGT_754m]|nr:polysaccharide deacetylase [SAR202 cluster bacterium AC-409-J13_OGT_754m]
MAGIWPGKVRCVVLLTFDLDGSSSAIYRNKNAINMPSLLSMGEYGPNIATPRILDLLDTYDIRSSFFIPGHVAESHSELVKDIIKRGHEVGHHGYMHEPPSDLDKYQEWDILNRGIDTLQNITGQRPLGYRSPSWELSDRSLGYIASLDFLYDSSLMGDDAPYFVDTTGGRIVELPIHWVLDDAPHFMYSPGTQRLGPMISPSNVFDTWALEFEGLYRFGRSFHLTLHPHIIGRPGRLLMLERLIKYIQSFPNVVFMRALDVARMWEKDRECNENLDLL